VALVFDISAGADALLARPDVTSLAGLRGRRIGVELNTTSSVLLDRALQKAGLSAGEVTVVPLALDAQQQALAQGEVDALATFDPVLSRVEAEGARVLFDSTAMPGEIVDVLVVRQAALDSRFDALAALVRAWGPAQQQVRRGDVAVLAQAAHRSAMALPQFRRSLGRMVLPDLDKNRELLAPGGPVDAQLGRLAGFMKERGWLKQVPEGHLVDDRLVRAALVPGGRK
jgi:NitT/TauT family transport system substrate-binding protein